MSRTFADIEALVVAYLEAQTGVRTVTELPNLLEAALPIIRVSAVGGVDDKITDRIRLTVETFAAARTASHDAAEVARMWMHLLAHAVVSGWVIDTVETVTRPVWVDYANDHVHRFLATYELTTRVRAS